MKKYFAYVFFVSVIPVLFTACAHIPVHVAPEYEKDTESITSLRASVGMIAGAGNNHARRRAIQSRLVDFGCEDVMTTEAIDWFTLQRNVIVDIPGSTDAVVYIVAHYDKADINPLTVASVLLNGALDDLTSLSYMSRGAKDNGTGVAVALEIAKTLKASPRRYSYRVLFTGAEEAGLRGSRAHVARLNKEEKDTIVLAVNLDTVGIRSCTNGLSKGIGSSILETNVLQIAEERNIPLAYEEVPFGFLSDFAPFKSQSWWLDMLRGVGFNLPGGFLPQRSWFTSSHKTQVLNFSCSKAVGITDDLAGTFLLPVGSIHGPRDTAAGVDPVRLYQQYVLVQELLNAIDTGKITIPPVDN